MHIVHVLAPGHVGGTNTVVRLLARAQRERGHQVDVIAILDAADSERHPFLHEAREAGLDATPLVVPPRSYGEERRRMKSHLRRLAPAVVHTHGYRADVVDGAVARGLGIPVVTTVHGFTGGTWKNRGYQWIQRRAFRRFDAVVAVSSPLVGDLVASGINPRRIHLVPNAYRASVGALDRAAARRALGLDPRRFVVGWVGRLSQEKGADVLIDALALTTRTLDVDASVIGDGPERAALVRRARDAGVPSQVHFHGARPNAERYFAAFDLFVLSSRTEGTPMVLFEAMAARVPIVATRVGGVPAMLRDAEARLIPSDDAAALASAMRACLLDPDGAALRASAARERLEWSYGDAAWTDRYDAIYARLRPAPTTSRVSTAAT